MEKVDTTYVGLLYSEIETPQPVPATKSLNLKKKNAKCYGC